MFVSHTAVSDVLFELTIFVLFVLLFTYVFITQGLPALRSYTAHIKTIFLENAHKKKLLRQTRKSIEKKIIEQHDELTALTEKINRWKLAHERNTQNAITTTRNRLEIIARKRTVQNTNFAREKTEREVIPKAIAQAHQAFTRAYSDAAGRELLEAIVQKSLPHKQQLKGESDGNR